MSLREYLLGRDQTKTIEWLPGWRVPCRRRGGGRGRAENFGEPKWLAWFEYTIPSLNAGGRQIEKYGVYEPQPPPPTART